MSSLGQRPVPDTSKQGLFTAVVILFMEKLFLRFVAINFHQRALADRLAENRLGLKALDRLSNAPAAPVPKRPPYSKKGHKQASFGNSLDMAGWTAARAQQKNADGHVTPTDPSTTEKQRQHLSEKKHRRAETKRRRRKFLASIIVDHVGGAIGQVALKNSKFHKKGELSGLASARKLAKKLFVALNATSPGRSYLVEEGECLSAITTTTSDLYEDFYPYFRSTVEAVCAA